MGLKGRLNRKKNFWTEPDVAAVASGPTLHSALSEESCEHVETVVETYIISLPRHMYDFFFQVCQNRSYIHKVRVANKVDPMP